MKKLLVLIIAVLLYSGCSDVAGTSTEVNTGSIAGIIQYSNSELITDTIKVKLFKNNPSNQDIFIDSLVISDGNYKFDSLQSGTYSICVYKDTLKLAIKSDIALNVDEQKENVDITIEIMNGDFEKGTNSWYLVKDGSADGDYSVENGELHLHIKNSGSISTDLSVRQRTIHLYQGNVYEFSFDAYSTDAREIDVSFKQSEYPYSWLGWYESRGVVKIDQKKTNYKSTFLMTAPDYNDAMLVFDCGGDYSSDVIIDNVSLRLIDTDSTINIDNTLFNIGDNLIINGDFSSSLNFWNFNGNANGYVENGEFILNVTELTNDLYPWDASVNQLGFTLIQGYEYELSFSAYSTNDRPIQILVSYALFPWPTYYSIGSNGITYITSNKTTYTNRFTMEHLSNNNSQLTFNIGADSSDVKIDDVSLKIIGEK